MSDKFDPILQPSLKANSTSGLKTLAGFCRVFKKYGRKISTIAAKIEKNESLETAPSWSE